MATAMVLLAFAPSWAQDTPGLRSSQKTGAGQYKIGIVNRKAVMDGFKKARKQYEELQDEVNVMQKDIDRLSDKIQSAKDKYEEDKAAIASDEKADREDAIQSDYLEYQALLKTKQADIDSKELRLMKRLFGEIDEAVAKVGAEEGYHLILEGGANARSGVIYHSPTIDMSQKVIDVLNAK